MGGLGLTTKGLLGGGFALSTKGLAYDAGPPPPGILVARNRLESLLAILVAPMQTLENALIQLLTERFVNTAVGAQLDVLGRLVGQLRGGLTDDVYRRYIRARIATNRSDGKREDIIRIARLVLNDPTVSVYVVGQPIATCYVRVGDLSAITRDVEAALFLFLSLAVGAGVRLILQSNGSAASIRFKFSGGTPAGLGFDSTVAPGIGGHLASVLG